MGILRDIAAYCSVVPPLENLGDTKHLCLGGLKCNLNIQHYIVISWNDTSTPPPDQCALQVFCILCNLCMYHQSNHSQDLHVCSHSYPTAPPQRQPHRFRRRRWRHCRPPGRMKRTKTRGTSAKHVATPSQLLGSDGLMG